MTNRELLTKIDRNAAAIRAYRPLSEAEVRELDAYYKIGTTYTSNALEGNSLTISETKVLLEDGITVGGKPIRDCYEATGHAKAYDYMLSIVRGGELSITEDVIRRLHRLFYHGIDPDAAGEYRTGQVFITGTEYVPPAAEEVPACMAAFVAELPQKREAMHPVEFAAYAHRRLVDIHPFQDGNGRIGRMVMFRECLRSDVTPFIVGDAMKQFYYRGLANYEDEPGWLLDTCRSFQDDFVARFLPLVPHIGA